MGVTNPTYKTPSAGSSLDLAPDQYGPDTFIFILPQPE
jgi:hypothetical protein